MFYGNINSELFIAYIAYFNHRSKYTFTANHGGYK